MGVEDYLLDSFALLRTSLFCSSLKANFLLIFLLLEYVLFELFIINKYYILSLLSFSSFLGTTTAYCPFHSDAGGMFGLPGNAVNNE